eukprot:TRINITY_DN46813_c0_g1_i1.p1 TRINITY_DN46813_c0_g1~~TRINITY_DN46813_c0_g1_i1.p1  ORF type:complete len:459 (+),score=106.65 TRINITY_DN46813_c0_g1_i1:60-1379(+)
MPVATEAGQHGDRRPTTVGWWWYLLAAPLLASLLLSFSPLAAVGLVVLVLVRPWPRLQKPSLPELRPGSHKDVDWAQATKDCPKTGDSYLVIGVGFLGRRLVDRLLERGETRIRLFDIAKCTAYDGDSRVESVRGDVTKYEDIRRAMEGVDCVYSTFALIQFFARLPHQAALSERVNVGGTENVMRACRDAGVKTLVYTSTSNVMVAPGLAKLNMDETSPLVSRDRSHNHYSWTKAAAEGVVLKAAAGSTVRTAIIRPCSVVFGPGDVRILERTLQPVAFGKAFAPMVHCSAVNDYVYVDNVVLGELKAEARLREGASGVSGEVFNISNEEPLSFEEFLLITSFHAKNVVVVSLPKLLLTALAHISETAQLLFRGKVSLGRDLDQLTPATLATTAMSYTVDCSKARTRLNWAPLWNVDQAVQQSIEEMCPSGRKPSVAR